MGGVFERRRRRAARLFSAPASAALTLFTAANASPWGREEGGLFLSSRASYFRAEATGPAAIGAAPEKYERYDSDTYLEYGLSASTMIGAKVVYGTSTYFDGYASATGSGFSEIEGFIQRTLWRGENEVLSLKLAGAAPSGFEAGPRPDLQRDGADLELRALYGRNLLITPFKLYATAEAGYRRRFGDSADQLRADFALGAEPAKNALLLCEVYATKSLRNEDPGGADYDVLKIQPSLIWRAGRRWSLQAGVTHEAAGRNLLLGDTYFISLWTTF